ncbi:hypothetical protein ABZ023_27335 [Streptomyces sp. NPDC006367]|uniref:hypothetical protein n=1 Tax=unclassified Streptomyces TaxID=2593676 RepID=UPI0033A8B362
MSSTELLRVGGLPRRAQGCEDVVDEGTVGQLPSVGLQTAWICPPADAATRG